MVMRHSDFQKYKDQFRQIAAELKKYKIEINTYI